MEQFGKYEYIIDEVCSPTKKSNALVRKAIPILIGWVKKGETNHTYSELNLALGYKQWQGVGSILGYISDIWDGLSSITHRNIPKLNAIVRSKNGRLPSYGFSYVESNYERFSEAQKEREVHRINQCAVSFTEWDWVMHVLGLKYDNSNKYYPDEVDQREILLELSEGAVSRILVNRYERSDEARSRCIKIKGCKCAVCGINFEERYGDIGKGFIHIHHLTPISSIGKDYQIDYEKDLVPVCPNCHAMLHRKNPPYTIEELKQIIK